MPLVVGSRLGPYEVLAPLGAGGMGEVYKARDTRLDRSVAIKVLPSHLSSNPDLRARFEREARAASALNHPHICTLHDIGQQDGIDYLVLEHLEGETLADRLAKGPLPIDQVLRFGMEIADALGAAHKAGIVHRDLKPGNVMVTKAGAKLLDFGLAKLSAIEAETGAALSSLHTATAAKPLTSAGTIMGTFQYMAPEQVEGGEADARTDVWALGAVLYEMATGRKAFAGKSQASLIAAILKEEPAPMRDVQPVTPPALDRLVRTCLAKDPDERMQSARDVARELGWMREAGSETSARRRPRVSPALATLAALVLGSLAGFWVGRRSGPIGASGARDTAVTRSVIELPPSTPLGVGTAAVGFDGTLLALSPDGRWLVYVGESGGVTRLYRRALDRFDEPAPIVGTEGAVHAFFSPDSRHVGFLTDDKVKRVSIEGDDLRTLCPALSPVQGSWTLDDTISFADDEGRALRRTSASGGGVDTIQSPDLLDRQIYFGDALPDGKAVLLTEKAGASGDYGVISLLDLQSRRSKVLVQSGYDPRYVPPGHILFARAGNLMTVAFDAGRGEVTGEPAPVLRGVAMDSFFGHAQVALSAAGSVAYLPGSDRAVGRLARVDRRGRVEVLPAAPERYGALDLSPDGTRLAVHVADVSDYVWIWDQRRNEGRRITGPSPAGFPIWSPSGELVAVQSWHSGSNHARAIQTQYAEGREPPRMLLQSASSGLFAASSWAGTKLCLTEIRGGQWRTGVLSTASTASVEWDETPCALGAISRDGQWMACSREGQIQIRSLKDRTLARQISTDGGIEPRWCGACDLLFFRKGKRWLATSVSFEPELRWDPPRVVFETDFLDTPGISYDMSPDGQYLYVVKSAAPDERRKLHLVTGWLDELRDLAPPRR
jgi:serine/threonine-protein kinase